MSISVTLLNTSSAKSQQVTLPRAMAVSELQRILAGKAVGVTLALVDGCSPAPATTMGDLYDYCATKEKGLEVRVTLQPRFGAGATCCTPCCSVAYDAKIQDEINKQVAQMQQQIDAQGGTDAIVEQMIDQNQ